MGSQNLRTSNLEMSSLARTPSQSLPFALDSLYHAGAANEQPGESSYSLLQPSPFAPSGSCFGIGAGFQAHRRSTSEVVPSQPSGLIPWKSPGALDMVQAVNSDPNCARRGVNNNTEMMGGGRSEMVNVDEDMFSTFMDLDYIDASNPSSAAGKSCGNEVQGAFDCQDKVIGVDGCETEENSRADESWRSTCNRPAGVSSMPEMGEELKRVAEGDVSQMNLNLRSVSDDSFMQNTNLDDGFLEIPSYPGTLPGQLLSSIMSSSELNSNAVGTTLGGVTFTGADVNKIMENHKLSEIALRDPRRAKRILSNRRSAARSKERKLRYVAELEHRNMTLQKESTMLASQLAQLERNSSALTNQNNELKLRLQALEQQAHLQEALKAALTDKLQRLKLENEASSSKIHHFEILQQLKKQETDEMQPPRNQTESQQANLHEEATTSAEHESKQ
ncbi:bZIP transcription factor 29-like [Primulina tabacum]|uniref:bZIP transcription factor 29-like n=1 Tax=Primulina tabacum TaxID=48773 RepID=UPI003F59A4C8